MSDDPNGGDQEPQDAATQDDGGRHGRHGRQVVDPQTHAEDPEVGEPEAEAGAPADDPEARVPAVSDVTELKAPRQTADEEADAESDALAREPEEVVRARKRRALEALVFVSDRVVTPHALGKIVKLKPSEVKDLMAELSEQYADRGVQLIEVSGGYQFRSAPACADYVREMIAQRPVRLTRAQLETLALVAYRQPITRPEIDEVRGVDTGSAVKVLLERGLIKMLGRKDEAGRPMLYGTAPYFLEFFGLNSLRDLPTLKEFTDLSEENRTLFKRKTGESVEDAEAELAEQQPAEGAEDAGGAGDVTRDTSDVEDGDPTVADAPADDADAEALMGAPEAAADAEEDAEDAEDAPGGLEDAEEDSGEAD